MNEAIQKIQDQIKVSEVLLEQLNEILLIELKKPENNIFEDLLFASAEIEDVLYVRALNACEGSYNCGLKEYEQLFMVGDKNYKGILEVEYNRHDKTYYYIDGTNFKVEEVV
jgi:hypothetical protein